MKPPAPVTRARCTSLQSAVVDQTLGTVTTLRQLIHRFVTPRDGDHARARPVHPFDARDQRYPAAVAEVLGRMTVVVPTLGRPLLRGCLASIVEGDAWPARLVVVDQGTSPDSDRWLAEVAAAGLAVDHVRSTQRGTAAGTNRGLERVTTDLVAITHDDCLVEPGWLARMADRIERHPDAVVTGRVAPEGDEPVPSTRTTTTERVYERPDLRGDPLFPANMGMTTDVARFVGPFDEDLRLRFAEDGEWCYRALSKGVPLVYAPEVRVRHVAWRDATQRAATYRGYARSQGAFYGKYLRARDPFIARRAAFDLARGPWMWVRGRATGDSELRALGRAYVRDLLPGLVTGLRRPPTGT